jgi:competence protein ComEC
LAARVMVVGHHGSKTSSRQAFLNAVGASVFVVSSGPTKYGSVTLPDQEVITELSSRGQVFRTDTNDQACAMNPAKIGPDNDGHAGGCDNIRIVIAERNPLQVSVWHGSD